MVSLIAPYFFVAYLPFCRFFFTYHVDPIIEEVESGVEVAFDSMVVPVYDPPPFRSCVCLLEVELVRAREAFAQVLKDRAHVEKEVHKWSLIGDYFYKKAIGWKPHCPPTPPGSPILSYDNEDSGDEFLNEEVAKQKGAKK